MQIFRQVQYCKRGEELSMKQQETWLLPALHPARDTPEPFRVSVIFRDLIVSTLPKAARPCSALRASFRVKFLRGSNLKVVELRHFSLKKLAHLSKASPA
jgi:hypothetical protein